MREKPSNSLYSLLRATGVDNERSSFHKDFKMRGFLSEKGQKDKLSSVLRAITPGLYLRNVLETTENLILSRLMKFLQSHFVERNTTDLCQHLSSITQGSQETAAKFVYRAMSLRQKLIVLLKSPAAEINYDQKIVQRLFLKSLETRLTSKTIMTEIKPLLRNPRVLDEDLIFAVGQASSNDQQRSVKLNKSKIRPKVNAVEMKYEADNELNLIPSKQDSTKASKSVETLDLLRSVQKELSNLRTDVNTLKKPKKEVRDHRCEQKDKYMCKRCLKNDEEVCTHCFKCCGEGHCQKVPVKLGKPRNNPEDAALCNI